MKLIASIWSVLAIVAGSALYAYDEMRERALVSASRLKEAEFAEKELELARSIQERLLPATELEGDGYQVVVRNVPAHYVAGDFYDIFSLPDGALGLVVADVAGKGTSAALVMARLCSDVRYALATHEQAADAVGSLNHEMIVADLYGRFVTLVLAILDPRAHKVQIANAGHPLPMLRRQQHVTVWSPVDSGPPLGVAPDWKYQQVEWDMSPGDALLLYTDGLSEHADGAFFPTEAERCLEAEAGGSLDAACDRMRSAVLSAAAPTDDMLNATLRTVYRSFGDVRPTAEISGLFGDPSAE